MLLVRVSIVILSLGVFLTACVRDGGPSTPVDPGRELSGTVQTWQSGTATIRAIVTDAAGENIIGSYGVTGELTAEGRFELTLPTTPPDETLYENSIASLCEGAAFDGTAQPETWQESIPELIVEQDGETIGYLGLASSAAAAGFAGAEVGDKGVFPGYLVEPLSVQGSCSDGEFSATFDVEAEAGWTLVLFTLEGINNTSGFPTAGRYEAVEAIPTGVAWYFVENEPAP